MGDPEGIGFCSMGVIDIRDLNNKGVATAASFCLAEVRASNPEWEPSMPRPTIKYPVSCSIELTKVPDSLTEFSIKGGRDSDSRRTLREAVFEYVFKLESTKNLFCIHSRPTPEFYYDRTVLNIPRKLNDNKKPPFPSVLIVTESSEHSQRIWTALFSERSKKMLCGISNLDRTTTSSQDSTDSVIIGSTERIDQYFDRVAHKRQTEELVSYVKFIIINSAEKMQSVPTYKAFMESITDKFRYAWTRFIFMYNFTTAQCDLSSTVNFCQELNTRGMYIEVDKRRVRDLFQRVEFELILPPDEIANHLSSISIRDTGEALSDEKYEKTKLVSTVHIQKLKKCMALIEKLRAQRNEQNNHHNNNRRERILVVTKNHRTAIFVMLMLTQKNPPADPKAQFNINAMVEYDTVDTVEKRNFEFRHGTLDVLVIDWKSMHSVIRGTVDSVIMYDRPHPRYFQTIMEVEMENLTSRNSVKLKLFIFVDQAEDLFLLPEYVKFVEKYKKKVPQWFGALYQKFRENWSKLIEERERSRRANAVLPP